jgi:hypothetical protein
LTRDSHSYFVTLSLHPPFVMSPPSAHTTSRPTRGLTTRLKNPGFFRAAARPLAERDCAQAKGPIVRKGMFKRMIFEKRLTKYEGRQNALLLRTSSFAHSYFVTLRDFRRTIDKGRSTKEGRMLFSFGLRQSNFVTLPGPINVQRREKIFSSFVLRHSSSVLPTQGEVKKSPGKACQGRFHFHISKSANLLITASPPDSNSAYLPATSSPGGRYQRASSLGRCGPPVWRFRRWPSPCRAYRSAASGALR